MEKTIRNELRMDMLDGCMPVGEIESCLNHWSNKYEILPKSELTQLKAENERLKGEVYYWKTLCQLAEDCLEKSPCDPDITSEQIEAWKADHRIIKQFGAKPLTTNP